MKKYNILAIDNNEEVLKNIKSEFDKYKNVKLDIYIDPINALLEMNQRLGSKDQYHLAIIDLNMPILTGEITSMLFKAADPLIKTVLYTGSKNDIYVKHMDCYGFDSICLKRNGSTSLENEVLNVLNFDLI